jgi:hypothetical protein
LHREATNFLVNDGEHRVGGMNIALLDGVQEASGFGHKRPVDG